MRFIDEATIRVSAGRGGPGSVSFRREAFAPRGGPDGGDGGAGGDVIFQSSIQLRSLQDFRFRRVYQAQSGLHGSGGNKTGKDGEDIIIKVPVGTVVKDAESGEILFDFTQDQQTWIACEGGRGGKGNSHFATATHQAPKFAQPGEEGTSRHITLELKLLADVGLIGFPNAGKSTLISRISRAHPKIADYPFTTLAPNLGVVPLADHRSYVVADIPGLVEGAHEGKGLGHKFLRHIERTRLFVHLLDGTELLKFQNSDGSWDFSVLVKRYEAIRKELRLFSDKLIHKPELLAINKIDTFDESHSEALNALREVLREKIQELRGEYPLPEEPLLISGVSGKGIPELVQVLDRELHSNPASSAREKKSETPLPDDKKLRD